VMGNLARQFTPADMTLMGAYYLNALPVEWAKGSPPLRYVMVQPPETWRGARYLRWLQLPYVMLRGWWALVIGRCQGILSVYPDAIYLLVGYLLSLITGRALYAYFHNTYVEAHKGRLARWLQPRVFRRARHVFVMSEGMRTLYAERYPTLACSALPHTFSGMPPPLEDAALPPLSAPLQTAFMGSVWASVSDALERMIAAVKAEGDVRCALYTGTPYSNLTALGATGAAFTISTPDNAALRKALRAADILLLPHAFQTGLPEEEIRTIFPTKTLDYLLAGRPILAHLPANCFLADFLRNHDCALLITEPTVEAVREGLRRLRGDRPLRERLAANALRAAAQIQAHRVADHLRDVVLSTWQQ